MPYAFNKGSQFGKYFATNSPGQFTTSLKHTKMHALFVCKMK